MKLLLVTVTDAVQPRLYFSLCKTPLLEPFTDHLVFAAGELSTDVAVLVVEPEVVSVVDLDVSEPQASADIAVAFVVLVPVSVVVVEDDSSGRPRFLAFPNVDYHASSSSSFEVVG